MLIVQKYGGVTLESPARIKGAAARIARLQQEGHQVVAIVSAMGQTTNQLLELAGQISDRPNRRELDMLLTAGERISMAALSMALHEMGCQAVSYTGSQAGILTNNSHGNAFITNVRAVRVSESLQSGKVVVLAGFQGVSPTTKEITTLGRGGTDTTAMAMAVYLKADRCEILKDVAGVFSADPRIVPDARPLQKLSYGALAHMCYWGAKVLHYRSAELAALYKVPLYIGSANGKLGEGTFIGAEEATVYETARILSLNSHERVFVLESSGPSPEEALKAVNEFLEASQLPWPQILSTSHQNGTHSFWLTGPRETMARLSQAIGEQQRFRVAGEYSAIAATCGGVVSSDLLEKVISLLSAEKIPVHSLQMTSLGLTVFAAPAHREKVIHCLHTLIEK